MKEILKRLLLALAITLVAFALASLAHAQQADEDPTPVAPQAQPPQTVPQTGAKQEHPQQAQQNAAATKSSRDDNDDETQDALTFTGRIVEHDGQLVLHDPVTKIDYQLDDPGKAKSYVGKQVKIVGKLGMKENTIHIESIEPAS
jgi:hypothetical protein